MARPEIGQRFAGKYRIEGLLGSGGVSEVYRATALESGRPVALKVLAEHTRSSPSLAERMLREAELGRRAEHPNLLRVLDGGLAQGDVPFVVTEYLDGRSLGEMLRARNRLPVSFTLAVVKQAARGLTALHRRGVVHGDVKPDNLVLARARPGRESLKVIDYGFAREIGERDVAESTIIAGTMGYLAPEQVATEAAHPSSDIYAMGVVLFRLLTGELPFDTKAPAELLGHHLFSAPPPPSWLRPQLGRDLDCIVQSAMRKSPTNRYPTLLALIDDIERVQTGHAARGVPVSGDDRFVPCGDAGRRALRWVARRVGHGGDAPAGASYACTAKPGASAA